MKRSRAIPGDPSGMLLRDLGDCRPLTRDEQATLAAAMRDGDRQARDRLVTSVLPWLVSLARRRRRPGEDVGEMVQAAALTLCRRLKMFDEAKGTIASFAAWAARSAWDDARQREAKQPSVGSLDAPGADGQPLAAAVPDGADPDAAARRAEHREDLAALRDALGKLDPRTVAAIMEHARGRTFGDIGRDLDVTPERTRQLRDQGIRTLRKAMTGFGSPRGR